ncbi:MAG: hypothetical protein AAF892_05835 [Cyanobacteria bacterium P01_D01_bin.71]
MDTAICRLVRAAQITESIAQRALQFKVPDFATRFKLKNLALSQKHLNFSEFFPMVIPHGCGHYKNIL